MKLLFVKNMNFFIGWIQLAFTKKEMSPPIGGYHSAPVIFKSSLVRVEFTFEIRKYYRQFYFIFKSVNKMSVVQMPFA